ncbi:DEAD/DEAH box helicase [Streptomyces cinereoruber]|uniref:DEAD/DEAH box helicase n=1 Tax=Streptomyces cinereoruber TaxID=67260 RepID=A0AAV4KHD8_9ACTN|nr:DEAD/DEAH box helicase [Streptomyces cinereoruber]MBB4160422.1 superfamily II DNA/RNA helicase [Streptomyces cinereoruber]MBY8818938.1 DEAD/DEAH box helicase [Streptomyces cinereoruber]NIH63059.1 superfamily II DNA/RNA helicase [Streptomyces cinereoruber]QEV31394.1 DEAD/DEAH box helicase [Streptomyces cinereoruber]GGR24131.1 DEAD/DEAH box helicase [Streptomyces cinereoruber]
MNSTPRTDDARKDEFAASPTPATGFAALGLPAEVLRVLGRLGVEEPFPIQAATLPDALAGRDVLGRGRTGSGKTLAFGLPLLVRTAGRRAEARRPLGLVLVPTRELAQQVTDALAPFAEALGLRLATVVGGMSIGRQAGALRDGAEVLIATPGRLMDLVERKDCRLDRVAVTVLDEADRMADLGFMPQVTELLDQVRPEGQRLLFSATLDRNVDLLVERHLTDPVVHAVDPSAAAVSTMEHHVLHVHGADKFATATEIAARDGRVIMFLHTKHAVDRFAKHLLGSGVRAAALHGGKSQPLRTRTLDRFRSGEVPVLVATDVAARGIHVDALDLVVNVDPPADGTDYLHRGGRTARAGESGVVVTLVTPEERRDVARVMADAGIRPTVTRVRSGEAELTRITGARKPSGVPVDGSAPTQEGTRRGGAAFRGIGTVPGRPGRAKNESRRAAEARKTAEARRAAKIRRGG